jgi:hypothetical protein
MSRRDGRSRSRADLAPADLAEPTPADLAEPTAGGSGGARGVSLVATEVTGRRRSCSKKAEEGQKINLASPIGFQM